MKVNTKIVMDDNDSELLLIEQEFSERGIHAKYYSKEDAMWPEFHNDVQVAVIDYTMPFRNGLEISREILSKNPYCKVIIYSGVEDFDILLQANDLGVKWIKKNEPEHIKKLADAVEKAEGFYTLLIDKLQKIKV